MSTDKIKIIFLGLNEAGKKIYNWLIDQGENVVALLTEKNQLEIIPELSPDMVISCGFRHVVSEKFLGLPERGFINIHPAYLPYNRGANPNVWSIAEDTPAGVTIHYMDENIDTGKIIARREVEVPFDFSGKDLYKKLEKVQLQLFQEKWGEIKSSDLQTSPQPDSSGTYHKTDEFDELCHINPEESYQAIELINLLRALTFPPYDNAYVEVDGEKYYLRLDIYKESGSAEDNLG